jgi:hypothetical protein
LKSRGALKHRNFNDTQRRPNGRETRLLIPRAPRVAAPIWLSVIERLARPE